MPSPPATALPAWPEVSVSKGLSSLSGKPEIPFSVRNVENSDTLPDKILWV